MDPIVFAKLRVSCATKLLPVQVETPELEKQMQKSTQKPN